MTTASLDQPNGVQNHAGELPITNNTATSSSTTVKSSSKKLTLIPLIFLIYFEVAGGPYGEEPAVKAAGPLFAILGFLIFPFIWSVPEALITAELSTAYPGNGGFVIWADRAFGSFWGSLMGTWKFLSGVINIAAFPAMCIDYLEKIFPVFGSGLPRKMAILVSTLLLSFLNYTGLNIVGYASVALGLISLSPFILMSLIAIPKIHPHRWISLGQKGVKKDWNLFFNTLFWNLNFWDNVSTMAGEVDKPQKTFPLGLLYAVIFTCLGYIIPLIAVTGAISVDQNEWETGFMATAAEMISGKWLKIWLEIGAIAGKWLKYWVEVGAVLSVIGLYEAQLSSCAYQILGMANIGVVPKSFGTRSKWFNTPWVGILLSTLIALAVSYMNFADIIASVNFLYSLGMLLEFASFLWLRRKMPKIKRPYKVPLPMAGLLIMCLVPSGFLLYVMFVARKTVYLVSALLTVVGIAWYFLMKLCRSKKWIKFEKRKEEEEDKVEEEEENHG
ncbi:hypothetical protein M9H77_06070 [Catharanthus roseus]|uniref:Uncharacterized protein n=1 Tax=Catharanthus roseus TaxID=4058 RepID=A0ACC0BR49_CATRO|nr:hypothetical protein M9H77_06070 [Catharanthus roseus]